ncbi:ubiquitin domain-containing protein 2 [Harmonia axyridis]|uniref:ubiquitin domain-containing protein 2 n=1 Tax=Harmonia axyridis TaxID=115357 RepID=UPI001E27517A|nr:ubiquitin domain-containing protein 2 [Harmonia axyridis]XP_045468955.1 ubiquitin domain-containing protein 2 [Harmonia axyridis]
MGGCVGTRSRGGVVDDSSGSISRPNTGNTRKNHPLCHEIIRWKSDVPLTEGQLRSKRDEFWDTAPAFEGRKEIWDALRAATVAAEAKDYELAQAILDGASISVPNGYLTECYDELGSRYQVPIYCLSYPLNIVKEDNGRDSPAECSEPIDGGTETPLKLRLSHTCTDVKLLVYSTDTISSCKKKLQSQESIDPSKQRWFYGGKLLGDKLRVEEAKIPVGYIIQVIVNTEITTDKQA